MDLYRSIEGAKRRGYVFIHLTDLHALRSNGLDVIADRLRETLPPLEVYTHMDRKAVPLVFGTAFEGWTLKTLSVDYQHDRLILHIAPPVLVIGDIDYGELERKIVAHAVNKDPELERKMLSGENVYGGMLDTVDPPPLAHGWHGRNHLATPTWRRNTRSPHFSTQIKHMEAEWWVLTVNN